MIHELIHKLMRQLTMQLMSINGEYLGRELSPSL